MVNWTFFAHMGENAVRVAAAAALGAMGSAAIGTLGDMPWYGILSSAGFAALTSVLTALASLKVQPLNGTDSFIPKVVTEPTKPA